MYMLTYMLRNQQKINQSTSRKHAVELNAKKRSLKITLCCVCVRLQLSYHILMKSGYDNFFFVALPYSNSTDSPSSKAHSDIAKKTKKPIPQKNPTDFCKIPPGIPKTKYEQISCVKTWSRFWERQGYVSGAR